MNTELGKVDDYDLRPIRDIVYEHLKNAIMDQRLERGERLIENTIAEKMNVSRTPVREALRQLETEGFVVHMPRKGTVVQGISREDAIEIYNIREVLEGLVVRLACERRTLQDVSNLKNCLHQMEDAINLQSYRDVMELHHKFNKLVLEAGKSRRLTNMLTQLHENIMSLRTVSLETIERQILALEEHKRIVQAIEEQRMSEGEIIAREHIIKAKEAFLKKFLRDEKQKE